MKEGVPVTASIALRKFASKEGKLNLAASTDGSLLALIDKVPVAILTRETAKDNADLLTSTQFQRAVFVTASEIGNIAALNHYGFNQLSVQMPLSKMTAAYVAKSIASKTAAIKEQSAALEATMVQSLSLAAAGLSRGFFNGKKNVLKETLVKGVEQCGVENAGDVVAAAFAASSDQYHRELLSTALELAKKTPEVRNELSGVISEVKIQSEADSAPINTFARLERGGVPDALAPAPQRESASVTHLGSLRERLIAARASGTSIFDSRAA